MSLNYCIFIINFPFCSKNIHLPLGKFLFRIIHCIISIDRVIVNLDWVSIIYISTLIRINFNLFFIQIFLNFCVLCINFYICHDCWLFNQGVITYCNRWWISIFFKLDILDFAGKTVNSFFNVWVSGKFQLIQYWSIKFCSFSIL